jgi:hypothetical protein
MSKVMQRKQADGDRIDAIKCFIKVREVEELFIWGGGEY